jgi:hypothetical protein
MASRWWVVVAGILAIPAVALAAVLGLLITRAGIDPGTHGAMAVVAIGIALAGHIGAGGGLNLFATLLLLANLWLGTAASGGNLQVPHLFAGLAAASVSIAANCRNLREFLARQAADARST